MHSSFPLPDVTWEPVAPFWAGAERGELVLPKCDACGAWCWYPRDACRSCGGAVFTWTPVSGRATLYSWVVVTHPFLPAFTDLVPFVSALVTVDDAPGVRLATRIVDVDLSALAFDMPVEVVFRPLSFAGVDGTVTAPLFRPRPGAAR